MTPKQKEIIKSWGTPINEDHGTTCGAFLVMPDGNVSCLEYFIFTVAVSVLDGPMSRKQRWCYHTLREAMDAHLDWSINNFEGEPKGYIVAK